VEGSPTGVTLIYSSDDARWKIPYSNPLGPMVISNRYAWVSRE
jgi:hypothetical protein